MTTVILSVVLGAALIALVVALNRNAVLRADNARLSERLANLDTQAARMQQQAEERFQLLAAKSLADNAEQLRRENAGTLAQALRPIKENLENFRNAIGMRYEADSAQRTALDQRIRDLEQLNHNVAAEAARLANALKGNMKAQGEWGEAVLENILTASGLRKGSEYVVQQQISDPDGRILRPDITLNLPGGRHIVVDSKVSLTAYLTMCNTADKQQQRSLQSAHLASVKKHIAELADKKYQNCPGASGLDFVVMFIPHEGAYLAALEADPSLWMHAYSSNVIMAAPAHLMAILKLTDRMWRRDKQDRNTQQIVRQAGLLYDKISAFLADMERIDRAINTTRNAWNDAFAHLTGGPQSVVAKLNSLSALGASGKKPVPNRFRPDTQADEDLPED